MFKNFTRYMAETGAQGGGASGAPATSGAAPAGTPASSAAGQPAAPPAADMTAIINEAIKLQVAPLVAENKELKAKLAATEQGKANAAAEKATVEERLKVQEAETRSIREEHNREKADGLISKAADRHQLAGPVHREQGLLAFRAAHPVTVKESGELVVKVGAGDRPIGEAFDAWINSPAGAIYKAAAAQPGAGAPPASTPQGSATTKRPKDMSREEFGALLKSGVTCKLTHDPRAPSVTFKDRSVPRLVEARERLLGSLRGGKTT